MDLYDFARKKQAEFAAAARTAPLKPEPLVNGNDLIELGLKPGPGFKDLLGEAEDEQLEGRLKTREEALAWLKEKAVG